jgi:hypothetical protein
VILYDVFGIITKVVAPLYLSEEAAWKKNSTNQIRDIEEYVEFS